MLGIAVLLALPATGHTQSNATSDQTSEEAIVRMLQEQIAALQQQLVGLSLQTSTGDACHISQNLSLGSSGIQVTRLQDHLTTTGDYEYGYSTGYFGPVTRSAVMRFQERNDIAGPGLPGYGSAGPNTRAELNARACGDTPLASRDEIIISLSRLVRDNRTGYSTPSDSPEYDFDFNEDGWVDLNDMVAMRDFDTLSAEGRELVREKMLEATRNRFTGFDLTTQTHSLDLNRDKRIDLQDLIILRNTLTVAGDPVASVSTVTGTDASPELKASQYKKPDPAAQRASSGEDNLEEILAGYRPSIDAGQPGTGQESWGVCGDETRVSVTFFDNQASNNNVFGVHQTGNPDTFRGIFAARSTDRTHDVSALNTGETRSFTYPTKGMSAISFAIVYGGTEYSTDSSSNVNTANKAITYDSTEGTVIAFEDGNDNDFNDVVVEVSVSCN